MATFGGWLKTQRQAQGWSQHELARRLHTSQTHVSSLERGKRKPSPELARDIADTFAVPASEVLDLAYPDRPAPATPGPMPVDSAEAARAVLRELEAQLLPEDWAALASLAQLLARKNQR